MNKSELTATIADVLGMTKTDVSKVIDQIPRTIAKELKRGNKVQIFGLGSFEVRKRSARKGRNPSTGEAIKIKASKGIAFKAAKGFKDAI